jgi:hypothetical protein
MPLEAFPALLMQSEVVQTQAMVETTRICGRDPRANLAVRDVSENHDANKAALEPVRDFGVGLKKPKKNPSKNKTTLPVVGPGTICPEADGEATLFLRTEEIRGGR